MRIRVTQKDIDRGTRNSETYCPFAHAIRRRVTRGAVVRVRQDCIDVGEAEIDVPPRMAYAMGAFDAAGVMDPGTFEVDIPARVRR